MFGAIRRACFLITILAEIVRAGDHRQVLDDQFSNPHSSLTRRQQQVGLCPAGSFECVGYCCVRNSCCKYGAEPCCISGASCQVFDNAPLCCVQGVNCGPPLSSVAPKPSPTSIATSASTTGSSTVSVPPSATPPSSPSPGPSSQDDHENKLQLSDKIALGVGIAVGVPSAVAALMQMWRWSREGR